MWMLPVVLWILRVGGQTEGYTYEDDYYSEDFTEAPVIGGSQSRLDSASSVDDLLELHYPEYSLVQHCLRRKAKRTSNPPSHSEDDLWGQHYEAAAFRSDHGTFEVILEEIQRTMCRPREVCVEVSKENQESTSHFFVPRCVALHRCGGCCTHEALYCTNTSHTHVNKTLVELSPSRIDRSTVTVSFINHTSCECLPKRPLHSVIRRAAAEHLALCSPPDVPCGPGLMWDPTTCLCVPLGSSLFSLRELGPLDSALLALCGPNKVLEETSCECVCRNGLTPGSCGAGWRLDQESCECQCEDQPVAGTCPPNQRWDPQLCGCVCRAECPPRHPLNPATCMCQCRESYETCLLQGKRFKPNTCSCYRLPCRKPRRSCQPGFYYSHYVCQCVPNDWRN